jgi:integrase
MPRPNRPSWHKHSGRFRCRINGKAVYFPKSIAKDDKPQIGGVPRAAWDYLTEYLKREEGVATGHVEPTVYWLCQAYLKWSEEELAAGKVSPKQDLNRQAHLRLFVEHSGLADRKVRSLTPEAMDEFFARFRVVRLGKTGAIPSAYYVHNVGKTVRSMLRWAARPVSGRVPSRLVHPDPLDGYRYPGQPGAVRGYVEGAVVRRFLRWAWGAARWEDNARRVSRKVPPPASRPGGLKPPERTLGSLKRRFDRVFLLMLRFQRLTGCRPGEACGLEWSEVAPPPPADRSARWEPRTITIRPEKVKTRKQTTRARKIHVTPAVARLLRAIERLPGRHDLYVFTHMRGSGAEARGYHSPEAGEPWPDGSAASAKVATLRKRAIAAGVEGVEAVGPRKLIAYANRHAYASEGSSLGFTDEQVAEQLGNTPEVLRRVYSHTIDQAAEARAHEIAERRRGGGKRKGKGGSG